MGLFFSRATEGPGGGLFPMAETHACVNRSGSAYEGGDVVAIDLSGSVAEVDAADSDSFKPTGKIDSVLRTVRNVAAVDVTAGLVGIVQPPAGIANDDEGDVTFFGFVAKAYVIRATGTANPDDPLVAISGSQDLDAVTASGERIIGFYQDVADASLSTHEKKQVLFNGITGWGVA